MDEDKTIPDNSIKEKKVSIVIRAKNEGEFIGKTLSILYSQTYKNIEVILVDSGSTDNTFEEARKYPVKIVEIKPEDFTWGYALNYGFKNTSGEYVLCLSAHAFPQSDKWIEVLVDNFNELSVAAVASYTLPSHDCNPFDRRGLLRKHDIKKQELQQGPPYIISNSCSAIRKSVWAQVPFDETLQAVEEEDWAKKVRQLGYKIIYEPEAKVYHSHNETLKKIYERHYELSHAFQLLGFERYTLIGLLYDLFAGSVYDMLYVLIKRDNLKWFFFAPFRRFAINYSRYNAKRALNL